jgi:hypothetical protein
VGEIPLYFYIPMFPLKDFLMGWIRKIQKHKEERRNRSGNFKKTRTKERRKEKRRDFYIHGGSHTHVCSPSIENTLRLPPWCDPPSGEPTGMGTSPTTQHKAIYTKMLYVYVKMFQSPIDVFVFKISHFSFLVIILCSPKVQPVQYLSK